jgi:xanthine dehydrogenase accessory factor
MIIFEQSSAHALSGGRMENMDVMVLRSLRDWRLKGQKAFLATVTRTWGSSPGQLAPSWPCVKQEPWWALYLGVYQDDLISRFSSAYQTIAQDPTATSKEQLDGKPLRLKYGISADGAHRVGLPCGGTLELILEFNPDAQMLATLVQDLEHGQLVTRKLNLDTERSIKTMSAHPENSNSVITVVERLRT